MKMLFLEREKKQHKENAYAVLELHNYAFEVSTSKKWQKTEFKKQNAILKVMVASKYC